MSEALAAAKYAGGGWTAGTKLSIVYLLIDPGDAALSVVLMLELLLRGPGSEGRRRPSRRRELLIAARDGGGKELASNRLAGSEAGVDLHRLVQPHGQLRLRSMERPKLRGDKE